MFPSADRQSEAEYLGIFLRELNELHAVPYLVENESETVETLREILGKVECNSVIIAGLPSRVRGLARKALEDVTCSEVEQLGSSEAVQVIARADVGITWAEYGIAERGAVVEVVYEDGARLASSLPLHHIVMLSSKKILRGVAEATFEIGKMMSASSKRKPVVSLISGPSRTGDIEMRLLYGVHGPNSLYVLVLKWI